MKQYTHAWLAMMAIKRLEKVEIPETINVSGKPTPLARDAKLLVRLFKNYRDFVVKGAWYPDHVLADNAGDYSHSLKHTPFLAGEKPQFFKLPDTMEVYQSMKARSPIYKNKIPYLVVKGNLPDRCDAMAHTIVDNFKIQYHEEKGNPILPSSTHMALRFFMLSHYLADAHMPLHCDARSLGTIHAVFEEEWEKQIKNSYHIDIDNERFFYNPEGYPLALDTMTPLIKAVEEKVITRPFNYSWGNASGTREYAQAIGQYSYMLAQEMVPESVGNATSMTQYKKSEAYAHFEEYSAMLMADAVDSIARAWLHVWVRYRNWGPDHALVNAAAEEKKKAKKEAKETEGTSTAEA